MSEEYTGVEYSVYRGTGYLIEGKYVSTKLVNLILKFEDRSEDENDFTKDEDDFTNKFLMHSIEYNDELQQENHPMAFFTKIEEEGVTYVDPEKDIKFINKKTAESRVLEKKKWVNPTGLPKQLVNYMKKHATYGEIEFHHFTI